MNAGGEHSLERTARSFGGAPVDLEVDFAGLARPALVAEVLRLCVRGSDDVDAWTLPRRTRALIEVALAGGTRRLQRNARCPEGTCGEAIELEIELAAFLSSDPASNFDWSPEPGRMLRVALPTGNDQKAWLRRGDVAPRAMARQLIVEVDGFPPAEDWEFPENWFEGLEAELERRDPMTALELEASCPACGAGLRVEYDLEAELLRRFEAREAETLRHVHRLASVYHWPEAEILRLPAWRREYYLRQLEER